MIQFPLLPAGALAALCLLAACGDSTGPDGNAGAATLSGTVRAAVGNAVIEGATIRVGTAEATTDAEGRFELTNLPVGAVNARAERPGYMPAEATLTIGAGPNTHDFSLAVQEVYLSGTMAVYVPGEVGPLRGAIILLGGPTTSGFVTGGPLGASNPDLEQSLHRVGASLRALAKTARVALLGSEATALPNTDATDASLFGALGSVAARSGHEELANAPVLLVGLSAGAREAAGLVARNPERAIGLLLRVPTGATTLTGSAALAVPTFVMQAELDVVANNGAVQRTFLDNRLAGGLWALAVEPGVGHSIATDRANAVMMEWIATALALRLPAAPGGPLVALQEEGGWLGNQTTLEIAAWADYPGDRTAASWLLSQFIAASWRSLGINAPDGGS